MSLAAQSTDNSLSSELSPREFKAIAQTLQSASGIQLGESKLGLVKSRLQKRLWALELSSFGEYVNFISSQEGADELEELVCAMSTNVTAFNREPHHFEYFRQHVAPALGQKMKSGQPVRIWSAGCSNGSEPYTLSCEILDMFPEAVSHDIKILATDIDKHTLKQAIAGEYQEDMITGMPAPARKKWFEQSGRNFKIAPKPKSLVTFKPLNLFSDWPMKMGYDVIFCRNVLIYFNESDQIKLFNKFSNQLLGGGYLFIGHSERLSGPATERLKVVAPTTYQLKTGG